MLQESRPAIDIEEFTKTKYGSKEKAPVVSVDSKQVSVMSFQLQIVA